MITEINFKGKRVLVTGGAGFVGPNLVRAVFDAGGQVIVLDDLFTGTRDNIDSDIEYEFVEGSVTDQKLVGELVGRVDYVAHMAARNIIISTKDPREDYATNIGGTLNILLAARENPDVRVVYTSSASVYGNPRSLPILEDETPLTFSPYSVSKLAGENYCTAFYETYGVKVASVRYSNVYGIKQDPANPYCGVVSKFIEALDAGKPVTVHGDGLQTRDYTYVTDTVEATLIALLSAKADGMVFNIGAGVETSVLTLAEEIGLAMGKKVEIRHVDRRDIDNIRRRVLNIERIRSRLRWQPQTTLREGIRRTVEWWEKAKQAQSQSRA
ncbi:MAG: NAD-dependent epimerase/dehydratase family protein [candidate division Zixibacteria bacterium]|nr:NAD-dependent epimerase/dehydratase family protein [candidate division Zixibacteria bacterium]